VCYAQNDFFPLFHDFDCEFVDAVFGQLVDHEQQIVEDDAVVVVDAGVVHFEDEFDVRHVGGFEVGSQVSQGGLQLGEHEHFLQGFESVVDQQVHLVHVAELLVGLGEVLVDQHLEVFVVEQVDAGVDVVAQVMVHFLHLGVQECLTLQHVQLVLLNLPRHARLHPNDHACETLGHHTVIFMIVILH